TAIFLFAIYAARATVRRVIGAAVGGAAFFAVTFWLARIARSLGWWHFSLTPMPDIPAVLFVIGFCAYGSTLALVSWRAARRYGWRGLVAIVSLFSVAGPVRDYLGAAMTDVIVIAPGLRPALGWSVCWAVAVTMMYGAMRLVAGPARTDALAGSDRRSRSAMVSSIHTP
ncbi:MAG TPA: hypothetical protein VNG89_02520, partial [Vicinamibacterales bacterium]|nr:hypothetical protein [Vicinamibacterales bacterium]